MSPEFAVLLMVAITVALAALLYLIVSKVLIP